jgi:hypothetical protein
MGGGGGEGFGACLDASVGQVHMCGGLSGMVAS